MESPRTRTDQNRRPFTSANEVRTRTRTFNADTRGDPWDAASSVNWTPTWTLCVRQRNCFADSSGNCPAASRLLRQSLCGHSPVLREMFPGNCSDTARLLSGKCPDNSADVASDTTPDATRTLRGHGLTAVTVADCLRTGHGLDATADSVPDIRGNRLGRCPSVARTLAGYCPDKLPSITWTFERTLRRKSYPMLRGHRAACGLTFM